ncbi:MAG: alkaline phosphatase D family protein [Bryobacteraceae bacterium]
MIRVLIALACGCAAVSAQPTPAFPFGVASGDVTAYSAVLWTKTASAANLEAQVSPDADFRRIVLRRAAASSASTGLTAKVDIGPLKPATTYYYRWTAGAAVSGAGQFRTAPSPGMTEDLRFVFAGDSDGTRVNGLPAYNQFEVLEAARAEDPGFFVYLGDTVYTDSGKRASGPARTLDEYRGAYAENRTYAALRSLLAATSTYAVWDDHEFQNDFHPAGLPPGLYNIGRQAFLEWMPARDSFLPADPGCAGRPMFRVIRWGTEALIVILDERTCRSPSAAERCLDSTGTPDLAPALPGALRRLAGLPADAPSGCLAAMADPARTLLGRTQRELLYLVLRYFPARFKFIVSEVPVTGLFVLPYDRWEGYPAERAAILRFIAEHRIPNVVFVTADLHATVLSRLSADVDGAATPVAYEMVTGPIAVDPLLKTLATYPDFDPAYLNLLAPSLGVECMNLEETAYGVVSVSGGAARIEVKNDRGKLLCGKLLGP